MKPDILNLLKGLAIKYKVTPELIIDIYKKQFEYLNIELNRPIQSIDEIKSINIVKIGRFIPSLSKKKLEGNLKRIQDGHII